MKKLQRQLASVLKESAERLREARVPPDYTDHMEKLAAQVDEPCTLAVVGRAKAGKSTFINALLCENLAPVGVTETTATINFFRYGVPTDADKPIRCHWRNGRYENVDREFLIDLQGNEVETLRKAAGIEYLEYFLPNPILQDVTLVDTLGTEAAVDEHQNRTAEFLGLQRQLRRRHTEQTEHWAGNADAVIYLVGQVPRATDQTFLDEFKQATGNRSRALNAIGVMAKIDLQPEIVRDRKELSRKISEQLRDNLNSVVPVSAGIRRALDELQSDDGKGLDRLMTELRRIPPRRFEKLLDSDELYEMEFDDCPISVAERRCFRGDMPWRVFTTIARTAADPNLNAQAIVSELEDLAGFGAVKGVLERHFFKRGRFLRYYRILNKARQILNDVRYNHLPQLRRKDREKRSQRDRMLAFVQLAAQADPVVAKEIEELITKVFGATHADGLEASLKDVDRNLSRLFHEMQEYNADHTALQHLEEHSQLFSDDERAELKPLFGLYGVETENRLPDNPTEELLVQRQQHWADVRLRARNTTRRDVAERAEVRYGLVLSERSSRQPLADR